MHLHVYNSVWVCTVTSRSMLSQMGAQQGVAWGPSPGSEMIIMNINKPYTPAHTHIPTLITASVCLAKQEFYVDMLFFPLHFHMNPQKGHALQFPLVSIWSLWLFILLCCSAWKSIPIIWYPPSSLHLLFSDPPPHTHSFSSALYLTTHSISILRLSSEWGCWAKNESEESLSWAYFNWTAVHCYIFLFLIGGCESACECAHVCGVETRDLKSPER